MSFLVESIKSVSNTISPYFSSASCKEISDTARKIFEFSVDTFKKMNHATIFTGLALISYYFSPFTMPITVLSGVAIGYCVSKMKYQSLRLEYEKKDASNPDASQPRISADTELLVHAALTTMQLFSPVLRFTCTAIHGLMVGCKIGKAWFLHGDAIYHSNAIKKHFSPAKWDETPPSRKLKSWILERM